MTNVQVFTENDSTSKIYEIRGQRVMLDRDIASALGVEPRQVNENAARSAKWGYLREHGIEGEFRFQVSENDAEQLRSHNAIPSHSRSLPYVYTRKGCAYFGTSMESPAACAQAVRLVELFDKVHSIMDKYALANPDFALRRHLAIMDAAKFLASIPGYNPVAAATYVEHSLKDIQGIGTTSRTLLDVHAYLVERGMKQEEARKTRPQFGKALKKLYVDKFGKEPRKYLRMVEGAERLINSYTEADRDLFDKAWDLMCVPLLTSQSTFELKVKTDGVQ